MGVTTTTQIPNGVNFHFDQMLLHRATANLVYGMWAQKRPTPRNSSLNSIKFRRYSNLSPATTPLVEATNPSSVQFTVTDITATVLEYGNYVETSSTLDWTALTSEPVEWMEILAYNAQDTLDVLMRDAYSAGTNVFYGGNATARANVDSTDLIDVTAIKKVVRLLKVNNARRITNFAYTDASTDVVNIKPSYVGVCSPQTTYDLKALAGFTDIEQYAHSTTVLPEEIGKVDEVRFLETTNSKVFTGAGATSIDVHATLIFAQDGVGRSMITGEDMKMVVHSAGSAGTADPLDRKATAGWKTTFVAMILNNAYLCRIEHAVSA